MRQYIKPKKNHKRSPAWALMCNIVHGDNLLTTNRILQRNLSGQLNQNDRVTEHIQTKSNVVAPMNSRKHTQKHAKR